MKTTVNFLIQRKTYYILMLFIWAFHHPSFAQCGNDPVFSNQTACGSVISATVGVQVFISVGTFDGDNNNEHLTLSSGTLPTGAVMSPSLPENDNPPSSIFIWTPVAADIGQHIIEFTVTDICNNEATCSFTINVAGPCTGNHNPAFISPSPACGDTISAIEGMPFSFTVKASDVDAGNVVTLSSFGLPSGATMSPALPSGNPVSAVFNWTPLLTDAGYHTVTFQAIDVCQSKTFCTYVVDVVNPCSGAPGSPVFVAPSPACGSTISATVGVPVTFSMSASDVGHPNNPVTLNMSGNSAALSSAILTPSLPLTGNPVNTSFSWTPTIADIGQQDAGFVIHDPCTNGNEYCFYTINVIANVPSNDNCANALPITCGDTISGTTVNATSDTFPVCGSQIIPSPGVWYSFIGNGDVATLALINCNGTTTNNLMVFTGTCGTLSCKGTVANSCSDNISFITDNGTTYWILINTHNSSSSGTFYLTLICSPELPNDERCNATPINCGDTISGTTIGATFDSILPNCFVQGIASKGVWYSFVGAGDTTTISTCAGSDFDTRIRIFTNACINTVPSCITGVNNTCGQNEQASIIASAGVTYFVEVDAAVIGATGNFTLTLSCSSSPSCAVNIVELQNMGSCNDNGTTDPSDDFFIADVGVTYINPPVTGNLEIKLPGNVVAGGGATSIPVASLAAGSHVFTGIRFKADGTATVVEVGFTADPFCSKTQGGPTVHSCSAPVFCDPVIVNDNNPCTTDACDPANGNVTHTPILLATPVITGQNVICTNTQGIYTAVGSIGATNYNWTLPHGVTFISGQGTNTILVKFSTSCQSGNICVTASNNCSSASPVCIYINAISRTPVLNAINGQANAVCVGGSFQYCITPVTGATNYLWTGPAKTQITAGQGTNCITLFILPGFTTGKVSVTAQNCKGTSAIKSLQLKNLPPTPGVISGNASGLCQKTGVVYSIAAIANTTSYLWAVPTGATIVSGQTTNTITIDFGVGFTSGNLSVKGVNACGNGPARNLAVSGKPSATSVINGSSSVCKNQQAVAYSVTSVPGIIYNWTVPSGATVANGQGTASISVNWGVSSGNVKVIPSNACGNGPSKTKSATVNNCTRSEGSEFIEEEQFLVYPNPAHTDFTIEFKTESVSTEIIEVRNIIGEIVYTDHINTSVGRNIKHLYIDGISPGMYIITLKGSVNQYARISVE
ncbi:MAG: T9SS type A sorting domain-containing protein [Bacteroidota bacterium]